ncbi:hypothetical protein [Ignatzschineria sp. LJL83]
MAIPISMALIGCASVNNDIYSVNNENSDPIIKVTRDNNKAERISKNGTEECQTAFYINDTKVGNFVINDSANYQLAPGNYNFKVDNCQGRCSTYGTDVEIKSGETKSFTLSADSTGKPFIILNK